MLAPLQSPLSSEKKNIAGDLWRFEKHTRGQKGVINASARLSSASILSRERGELPYFRFFDPNDRVSGRVSST